MRWPVAWISLWLGAAVTVWAEPAKEAQPNAAARPPSPSTGKADSQGEDDAASAEEADQTTEKIDGQAWLKSHERVLPRLEAPDVLAPAALLRLSKVREADVRFAALRGSSDQGALTRQHKRWLIGVNVRAPITRQVVMGVEALRSSQRIELNQGGGASEFTKMTVAVKAAVKVKPRLDLGLSIATVSSEAKLGGPRSAGRHATSYQLFAPSLRYQARRFQMLVNWTPGVRIAESFGRHTEVQTTEVAAYTQVSSKAAVGGALAWLRYQELERRLLRDNWRATVSGRLLLPQRTTLVAGLSYRPAIHRGLAGVDQALPSDPVTLPLKTIDLALARMFAQNRLAGLRLRYATGEASEGSTRLEARLITLEARYSQAL